MLLLASDGSKRLLLLQFSHAVKMPEGTGEAQVNVIILAGSYNTQLVREIQHRCQTNTLATDSSITMLRGTMVRSAPSHYKPASHDPWPPLIPYAHMRIAMHGSTYYLQQFQNSPPVH